MKRVSGFRSIVWVAAAMLLVAAASAEANRLNSIREMVKQVIPKVAEPLSKLASNGKVVITAACVAAACVINFAAPAEAQAVDYLSSDVELMKTRGARSIFGNNSSLIEKSMEKRIKFSHMLGLGGYYESGHPLVTFRIGTSAEVGSFNAYLTTAFRTEHDMIDGIDGIGIKTRSFVGGGGLVFDYGEGNMSYGYLNTDIFVGGTSMIFRNARGYLLHFHEGPLQIAGIGYEYVDNDLNALSREGKSGDTVRSHGVALYRAGINYPITDLFTTSDALAINIKLNSAMHLGDIGSVKLGETWQGELEGWVLDEIGGGADLEHLLYHTAGGSINFSLADGRINFMVGSAVQHTIGGEIDNPGMGEDGDFDITNTTIAVGGTADIMPDHGISVEAWFERYDQYVNAELNGKSYDHDASGTWGRFALRKKF